jgi:hypothetical protein
MSRLKEFFVLLLTITFVSASTAETALASSQPGIFYTNVVMGEVPWSIQVVQISREKLRFEIQSRHAGVGALGLDTLSAQVLAARTDGEDPVAAINGGFYLRDYTQTNPYAGYPRGLQIAEGEVLSGPSGNTCLWWDRERQPHLAEVASHFAIAWPDGRNTPFDLNGPRAGAGIEVYTPAAGRSTHTAGGLELVLEPQAGGPWLPLHMERDYPARVREVRRDGNTVLWSNSLVLSLGPAIAEKFQDVSAGALVRISTRSTPALPDAINAISGGPALVLGGRPQKVRAAPDAAYEISSMLERHPRTAFGWNNRSFFLVQVDGRQKELSLGMTVQELSGFLVKLGCTEAINLDGGGSSCLWFDGKIRNHPCDGRERLVANSLIVLEKKPPAVANDPVAADPALLKERSGSNGN